MPEPDLLEFARSIMANWPEGDVDGGDLQDIAIRCGLLTLVDPPPTEPCGEDCNCADFYSEKDFKDGSVICYRLHPIFNR